MTGFMTKVKFDDNLREETGRSIGEFQTKETVEEKAERGKNCVVVRESVQGEHAVCSGPLCCQASLPVRQE